MRKQLFPLVSSDVALFSMGENCLQVLLVRRLCEPHAGSWALPGAVLDPSRDKCLEDTAHRALLEKLGVKVPHIAQVRNFDGVGRDPRAWSLSVLHYALLPRDQVHAVPVSKVDGVRWVAVDRVGKLAFDHEQQVAAGHAALRERVGRHSLPLHLMPEKFTLTQLQRVVELIMRTKTDPASVLDKGAFRRRIARSPDLVEVPGEMLRGAQRPAQLYRARPNFKF